MRIMVTLKFSTGLDLDLSHMDHVPAGLLLLYGISRTEKSGTPNLRDCDKRILTALFEKQPD